MFNNCFKTLCCSWTLDSSPTCFQRFSIWTRFLGVFGEHCERILRIFRCILMLLGVILISFRGLESVVQFLLCSFPFLCFVYFSFPFLVCFPCSFHAPAVSLILYMCCCWVVCYVCVLIFCSTLLSLVVVMFLCSLCATFVYAFLLWEHAWCYIMDYSRASWTI